MAYVFRISASGEKTLVEMPGKEAKIIAALGNGHNRL